MCIVAFRIQYNDMCYTQSLKFFYYFPPITTSNNQPSSSSSFSSSSSSSPINVDLAFSSAFQKNLKNVFTLHTPHYSHNKYIIKEIGNM